MGVWKVKQGRREERRRDSEKGSNGGWREKLRKEEKRGEISGHGVTLTTGRTEQHWAGEVRKDVFGERTCRCPLMLSRGSLTG